MANPIIELKNVSVVYNPGKTSEFWALRDINAEINPEEYVIFFGPSGCGKSTLLYTIAGLEFPSRGQVIVKGKNVSSLSPQELIEHHRHSTGMVFQAFYLIPSLKVQANILLPQMFAAADLVSRQARVKALMHRFGIFNMADKYPESLSGGQQQRVAIARALVNDPEIVLADEPTGNLDSENAQIVLDLLSDMVERDKRVVIHVTHNPSHLSRAHRVFYMQDGKITRIVTNPKKQAGEFEEPTPIAELARAYPHLPESRLKAKLIFRNLLIPYSIEDENKIEALIEAYLLKKISGNELAESLDLPPEQGGINLYAQTARSLARKIAQMAHEMELIESAETYFPTPVQEKAAEIRGYLLDSYQGQLELVQIQRLDHFLEERILGRINKGELRYFLDVPLDKGGVGLNRRTAKNFAEQVDIILSKTESLTP